MSNLSNPILWQESTYQRRNIPQFFQRYWGIGPLLIIGMVFVTAATLSQVDYTTRELAIYMIWVVQVAVSLRAILAGANTISREHIGQTWEALILTGIGTRTILFGKWRAALQRTMPWMLALGILRLAMLPIFEMALINRFAFYIGHYFFIYDPGAFGFIWVPWETVLAALLTVVLTILEALCSTAIGVAASAVTRRGVLATITAVCVRFIPVALFAGYIRYELGNTLPLRFFHYPFFSAADGGTAALAQLALPVMLRRTSGYENAIFGLVIAALVLIVLLMASVGIAWAAIRLSGALGNRSQLARIRGV